MTAPVGVGDRPWANVACMPLLIWRTTSLVALLLVIGSGCLNIGTRTSDLGTGMQSTFSRKRLRDILHLTSLRLWGAYRDVEIWLEWESSQNDDPELRKAVRFGVVVNHP
jgi:hypothetical protein